MPKTLICLCEDVTAEEIREAVRAGHDDLESLKRYLAVGTSLPGENVRGRHVAHH